MLATMLVQWVRPGTRLATLRVCLLSKTARQRPPLTQLVTPCAAMATSSSAGPDPNRTVLNRNLTHIVNSEQTCANRTLVLLFSWMLAKDRHMEKFNQFYRKYGYDVLIIHTLPFQLFLPGLGAVKNAQQILNFLNTNSSQYSNLVVHGFSVGAYQFGEVLALLSKDKTLADKLSPLFRAVIMDSAANLAAIPNGFSRALTTNPALQRFLRAFIAFYLRFFWSIATKYYAASEKEYCDMNHIQVPSLLLISEADPVGNIPDNQFVAECWKKRGIAVRIKVWKDSKHVAHYVKHSSEYEQELRQLLERTVPK